MISFLSLVLTFQISTESFYFGPSFILLDCVVSIKNLNNE